MSQVKRKILISFVILMKLKTILEVVPFYNHYYKFVYNIFQKYALFKLKNSIFWNAININFKNRHKKTQKT